MSLHRIAFLLSAGMIFAHAESSLCASDFSNVQNGLNAEFRAHENESRKRDPAYGPSYADLPAYREKAGIGLGIYAAGMVLSYGSLLLTVADGSNWEPYFYLGWAGWAIQKVGLPVACVNAHRAQKAAEAMGIDTVSTIVPWSAFAVAGLMELAGVAAFFSNGPDEAAIPLFFGKQVPQLVSVISAYAITARISKKAGQIAAHAVSVQPVIGFDGSAGLACTYRF